MRSKTVEQEPMNWLKLTGTLRLMVRRLRDAYETYINKLNSRKAPGKPVEFYVETPTLMK